MYLPSSSILRGKNAGSEMQTLCAQGRASHAVCTGPARPRLSDLLPLTGTQGCAFFQECLALVSIYFLVI